jgi:hypothetical protein
MFYVVKDLNPDQINERSLEVEKLASTEGWTKVERKNLRKRTTTKVKARWVGGGHKQTGVDKKLMSSPTARPVSHNLVLNLCALEKRNLVIGDIPAAYLQTDYVSASGETVRVKMDKHSTRLCVMAYPQYAEYVMDDGTMICAVNKALYGLVESAHLWYNENNRNLLIGKSYSKHEQLATASYPALTPGALSPI